MQNDKEDIRRTTRAAGTTLLNRVDDPDAPLRITRRQTTTRVSGSYRGSYFVSVSNIPSGTLAPTPTGSLSPSPRSSIELPTSPLKSQTVPGTFSLTPFTSQHRTDLNEPPSKGPEDSDSMLGASDSTAAPPPTNEELQREILMYQRDGLRAANKAANRMARLEEELLRLRVDKHSLKTEPATPTQETTGIDLTKFKTSDGPVFKGPYC